MSRIEDILENVKGRFGAESAFLLSSPGIINVETFRSGVPQLDVALGIGGWPKKRIVEVFGEESSGKTTLVLHAIANAQKAGDMAAFIDVEHALDPAWAENIGVDVDNIIISQPESGEEALELCEMYAREGIDVVAVDSVAALTPRAEITGEMGDSHIGIQARLMGQAMRKLKSITKKSGTTIFFTNQVRMKIGVMFGDPTTTPGGKALKFFASIRVRVTGLTPKDEDKDKDKEVVSKTVKFKVVKNKLAPPFKICEAKVGFTKGFDLPKNIFSGLVATGVIEKEGNTYYLEGNKLAVGKNKAEVALSELTEEEINGLYTDMVMSFNEDYLDLLDRKKQLLTSIEKKKAKEKDTTEKESELNEVGVEILRMRLKC